MDHRKLVLPEYMNDQGSLFGGYLLKWLDEFAYITASMEFPGNRFVTIALNNVEFRHPIQCGQILRFSVTQTRLGKTSVEYLVEVFGENSDSNGVLFATTISFVNVTETGAKAPIKK
ncbi:MAG: acyl-CoA thioesterase [Gammaproteobacteria bacterium]